MIKGLTTTKSTQSIRRPNVKLTVEEVHTKEIEVTKVNLRCTLDVTEVAPR